MRDGRRVKRSRAPKGYQDVITRIVPALGRDKLDGPHDVGVGKLHGAIRCLLDAHAEVARNRLERVRAPPSPSMVIRPPRNASGRIVLANEMRVGDGRLRATAPITGRSRVGPGGMGADAQHPPSSTQMMLPPPAPTVLMSSTGMRTR